jgi:hypothetical protein
MLPCRSVGVVFSFGDRRDVMRPETSEIFSVLRGDGGQQIPPCSSVRVQDRPFQTVPNTAPYYLQRCHVHFTAVIFSDAVSSVVRY